MYQFGSVLVAAIAVLAAAATPAYPESPKDQAALSGLKEVKVAFDLQNGDGKTLLKQLEVIDETRQSLIEQGVKPQFVLTFRGLATALVQTDQSQIKPEDRDYASKIAEKIHALRALPTGSTASSSVPLQFACPVQSQKTLFPTSRLSETAGSH